MKNRIGCILICVASLTLSASPVSAQLSEQKWNPRNWIKKDSTQEKTFEDEKNTPIGGKPGEEIKTFMLSQAHKMKKINGATVSTMRNGEILKVALPSSFLFQPNDTSLVSKPEPVLGPVLVLMREGMTNLVITGHSDNTGSPRYLENLTEKRAAAVYKWYLNNGISEKYMSFFGYGDTQPLFENDSMQNRNANRRITLYLIPNEEMLKKAKRKKLNK